jgi:hypothetical protein
MQDSYVSVNKDVLLKLCDDVIKNVDATNQKHDKLYIQRRVDEKNKDFFNRLFGKKYTFEEVKKEIHEIVVSSNNPFDALDILGAYPSERGHTARGIAERLKKAFAYSDDDSMYISARDLEYLHGWA